MAGEQKARSPARSPPRGPARGAARSPARTTQKKRGWRDIEALSERARLKKMLSDIWHEDIELDDDIFGERDRGSGYYTNNEGVEVEIEPAEDEEFDEFEDFEEED